MTAARLAVLSAALPDAYFPAAKARVVRESVKPGRRIVVAEE